MVPLRHTPRYGVLAAILAAVSLGAGPKTNGDRLDRVTPFFPLEVGWTLALDTQPSAAGVMDGTRVYVPLRSDELIAIERETGRVSWRVDLVSRWAPVASPTIVVVASPSALIGLDPATGAQRWSTSLLGVSAPVAIDGDLLVASTDGGQAFGIDRETGATRWQVPLGAVSRHPAAIGDGVALALDDSRVVLLDRDTGALVWSRVLEGTLSAPAVAEGLVLVGSSSNYFHALEERSGFDAWRWRAGGDVIGATADGDLVFFVALDNVLRAVSRKGGNQRWKAVVPFRPVASPIAGEGVVTVAGVAPRVEGFVSSTGLAQGTYAAIADLSGPPLIDPAVGPFSVGMVAITRDGRIVGLRPTGLMMRDPAPTPLLDLPGRRLPREQLMPTAP